jgi:hypothetical protein
MGAGNLAVNGIWFPDRPARSLSLYRQVYLNSIWEFISYHTLDTCNFHCTEINAICYSESYRVTVFGKCIYLNDKAGGTYRLDCVLKGLTGKLLYQMQEINMQTCRTLTYLSTPCSRVLLQKLTGSRLVKKLPTFYETNVSLPHSEVPANCPYSEPARSSPYPLIPLHENPS